MASETPAPQPSRLRNIQLLRIFSVTGVVLFHVYGMIYNSGRFEDATRELYTQLYYAPVNCWLINLAMPLFTLISGYLFTRQIERGKLTSWTSMLIKKAKRILIPYYIFTPLFMLTTNAFTWERLYTSYWHLWFLPMLMWCFVTTYALRNFMRTNIGAATVLAVATAVMFVPRFLPAFMNMKMLTHWYMYFAIGNVLALREGQLFALFEKTRLHYPMLAAGIIYAVLSPETYACNSAAMIVQQVLVLLPLWHITSRANLGWMDKSPTLRLIDDSSFGLYIFHYWIGQYMLSATAMRLLPLQTLAREHPYIFPFVLFIVTFAISLLLTALIKKTRVGRGIL